MTDIFNTDKKFEIIYADPPWSYYNDMTVDPDCTTVKGMRRPPLCYVVLRLLWDILGRHILYMVNFRCVGGRSVKMV